jgi:ATP-binding cassette, subfamily B, bacterial
MNWRWVPLTMRQDLMTLRRGLCLIYGMAPRSVVATALLRLVDALLPAAHVWLLKQIIDTVAGTSRGPAASTESTRIALVLAGSYFLLVCVQQSVGTVSRLLQAQTRDLLAGQVTLRVMEKTSCYQDLAPFESPRFHDRLQRLHDEAEWQPMNLFGGLGLIGQSVVTLLCMLLFLARFHPGIVLILMVAAGRRCFPASSASA